MEEKLLTLNFYSHLYICKVARICLIVAVVLPWILFTGFIVSILAYCGIQSIKDPEFASIFSLSLIMIILGTFFGLFIVFLFVVTMIKCSDLYERYSKYTEKTAIDLGLMEETEIVENNDVIEQQQECVDMKF